MPNKTLDCCCSQHRINLLRQEKNEEIGFTWSYFCLLFLGLFSSEANVFILLFSFAPCMSALVSTQCHVCFLFTATVAEIKKKEQPNSITFSVLLKVWLCLLFDYLFCFVSYLWYSLTYRNLNLISMWWNALRVSQSIQSSLNTKKIKCKGLSCLLLNWIYKKEKMQCGFAALKTGNVYRETSDVLFI